MLHKTQSAAGPLLLIFVRNPELGKVKQRLAATLGKSAALRAYKGLLSQTQATTAKISINKWVCYSNYIPQRDNFDVGGYEKKLQTGADLGQRMQHAFAEGFNQGHRPVLIIGSDCPELQPKHLRSALQALHSKPYVLGPAQDGGYYLLGMQQHSPSLFVDMPWGTQHVTALTLKRMPKDSYTLLPTLQDLDTAEDFKKLSAQGLIKA